ncbi:syntaxin-10-like isoform X2 [Nerophis lumbriciformis]|uniref:syntaxin-10-like isoform X2 n=1 Tax=Nerophis lumbriciformis TaxID=546530 RepID=UPI002AE0550F|nr:syntaxin-10-like isoform X2 [Nerophis lumbriciformis]
MNIYGAGGKKTKLLESLRRHLNASRLSLRRRVTYPGSAMSLEDPFFVVKGEVQKATARARGLFDRWEELLQDGTQVSRDELDWSTNELRNCLRAIDWDLEDLSETISIVESNPGKFRLGEDELRERRGFVEQTRKSVQEMKDHLSSPAAVAQTEKKNKEALLAASAPDRSTGLEAHLVSGSIRVLKDMSGRIGDELDQQAIILGDFGDEMDQTSSRMDSVLKKLEKVSHMTSSRRQWCAIGVLAAVLVVVLILFFAL